MLNPTDESIIAERVESLKDIGMINYFGMQRFGQFSIKTYELGVMVVKK
jgi:tRNA pseudouridine13 synthase